MTFFQKLLSTNAHSWWRFLTEGIQKFLLPEVLGEGRFIKIGIPNPEVGPFRRRLRDHSLSLLSTPTCHNLA